MEELIKAETSTFNVIYSSFAIHHLQEAAKQDFLKDCFRVLEKGGLFILIDVKREPGQTREAYNSSYVSWIQSDWGMLDKDEKNAVAAHLLTCEFPIEMTTDAQNAEAAGFSIIDEIDIDQRHGLLVFSKPSHQV
jgi:ubiquinone/menaquinone biosynthesis C-methylase UbiE